MLRRRPRDEASSARRRSPNAWACRSRPTAPGRKTGSRTTNADGLSPARSSWTRTTLSSPLRTWWVWRHDTQNSSSFSEASTVGWGGWNAKSLQPLIDPDDKREELVGYTLDLTKTVRLGDGNLSRSGFALFQRSPSLLSAAARPCPPARNTTCRFQPDAGPILLSLGEKPRSRKTCWKEMAT